MSKQYYKVDLHVHTPASQCYKGKKTEDGYWEILRCAVEKGVRLIAITDHNTIAGYEKLMELKKSVEQEYTIIQKYNISDEEKSDIQEKIDLFRKVSIIMGVEITLNPGIHIIVLCNEDAKQDIDSLLDDIGYLSERRGCDSDVVPEMDIKAFLSDQRLLDKIVLAPHVDSDKGIWKSLEGTYRAAVFKSSTIAAITCNNTTQLNTIKEITKSDPSYKRNKPFVCVNASDSHEPSSIGNKHSFIRLNDFSFDELKKAFESPEEYFSDNEHPYFLDYVKSCAEYKTTIFLENMEHIEKACYAIINNRGGCILLGINRSFHQNGIPLTPEKIEKELGLLFDRIRENNGLRYVLQRHRIEKLGNGRCVGIITIETQGSQLWIDNSDRVYLYCEKEGYKLAEIREIENIIRGRILTELRSFEKQNDDSIRDAMVKMSHVLNPFSKFMLYDKIRTKSVPITHFFRFKLITNDEKTTDLTDIPQNGMDNGNVYYTTSFSPRLEKSYLRYSCPVYQNNDSEYVSSLFPIKTPVIAVTLGGGCHLIETSQDVYFECQTPSLLLIPKDRFINSGLSIYNVIAWLKTDCFIWSCIQIANDVCLFDPKVLFNCLIPYRKDYYELEEIERKVKRILALENDFLKQAQTYSEDESIELINNICTQHNEAVNRIASEIEVLVNHFFEITEHENEMIHNDLKSAKVFQISPSVQESKQDKYELSCAK